MKYNIPLFKISTSSQDVKYIKKILNSGKSWAAGPSIAKFENEIKKLNKTKFAVSFNSGTSALIAMYIACNLKNKEIVVPSFTFIFTASSIILSGAKIKFCDIENDTYGLSYDSLKKTVTKKTKAVVIVHYSGCPAKDTIKIQKFCKQKGLLLLEDNAHSYGAKLNNQLTGTFGIASTMSFCQNKLVTTGEGGAVVTNNQIIYEKLKLIRSHGRYEKSKEDFFNSINEFDYIDIGYNFRISSINAALGISQIKYKYNENVKKRINAAHKLNKMLSDCNFIILPKKPKNSDHFYQQYTIRIKNVDLNQRDQLQKFLQNNGIFSRVYYEPIHFKTYYKEKYKNVKLPNTELLAPVIIPVVDIVLSPKLIADEESVIDPSAIVILPNFEFVAAVRAPVTFAVLVMVVAPA